MENKCEKCADKQTCKDFGIKCPDIGGKDGATGYRPKCAHAGEPRTEPKEKTLRDEFAMAALVGMIAFDGGNPDEKFACSNAANYAYKYADAMIRAREAA